MLLLVVVVIHNGIKCLDINAMYKSVSIVWVSMVGCVGDALHLTNNVPILMQCYQSMQESKHHTPSAHFL